MEAYGQGGVALAAVAAFVGLLVGSFLNVVIARVPDGKSVVRPSSACPECGHVVRWCDNVPVVSWLVLRGKCRDCGSQISWLYPAVEVVTAAVFGAVAWWWGASWMTLVLLHFAAVSVALAVIDSQVYRLPNAIVLPHIPVFAAEIGVASWLDGTARWVSTYGGGAALCGFLLVVHLIKPAGMGLGDVKLCAILGMFLGWQSWGAVVTGTFAGFCLGSIIGVAYMAVRRGQGRHFPFGPSLLAGAWLGLIWGTSWASAYLSLML